MRLDDELDTSLSKYPHLRDTLAVLLLIMAKLAQIEGGPHASMLELYLKGTYLTSPYQESHYNRVLSPVRYTQYLITRIRHM